jgi:hypothetical protein
MTKLTEQHLLDLGFKRVDVSKEESGDDNDFYYYDLDINGLGLISSDSDYKDNLNVSIFNYDGLNVYDYETLKELIDVLKKIQEQSKN